MQLKIPSSSYRAIGVMSGTSLDGLDICYSIYNKTDNGWEFEIVAAETHTYPTYWADKLRNASTLTAEAITQLDFEYGQFIGQQVKSFITNHKIEADFIASHGHTVLHNPHEGYTLQIGKGAAIAAQTGLPCIADFRSGDVSRGGQGAPLVPIGDRYLFNHFDICLNLGGIANLSFDSPDGKRIAYDISVCNMLLNHLALTTGLEFDKDGNLGKSGAIVMELLNSLENLPYYKKSNPKSLGKEWFQENIIPLFDRFKNQSAENLLRTAYEHISNRIADETSNREMKNMLVTGGGARNKFLMELIQQKSGIEVIIPNERIIDFKEALIFGFLGVLYMQKERGALCSVTGAEEDSIAGCLYF